MNQLQYSGDSANIAYYTERGTDDDGIWVESLHEVRMTRVDGAMRIDDSKPSRFAITVYRRGAGELAKFIYVPEVKRFGRLDDDTITRLVRERLET